jgi:hypothetical protein
MKAEQNSVFGVADAAPKARREASSICLPVCWQRPAKSKPLGVQQANIYTRVFWFSGFLVCFPSDRRSAVQKSSSPRAESWSAVEHDNRESR